MNTDGVDLENSPVKMNYTLPNIPNDIEDNETKVDELNKERNDGIKGKDNDEIFDDLGIEYKDDLKEDQKIGGTEDGDLKGKNLFEGEEKSALNKISEKGRLLAR